MIIKIKLKRQLLAFAAFILTIAVFSSCIKNLDEENLAREKRLIDEYIKDNNISSEPTKSGMYYIETQEGTGQAVITGDTVWVNFEARFLNGTVLQASDTARPYYFQQGTGSVIDGFDEGVSYMKRGGEATFIIPSWLAYGSSGNYGIPGYTTIVYDVRLLDDAFFDNEDDLNEFLNANGIITQPTSTGLYYIETETGLGDTVIVGDMVNINYTGMLLDSTVFDSSDDSGMLSFQLGLGKVIDGMDEGVSYMKKGGKATLIIPPELAYGLSGRPGIPPKSYLVFDIELLDQ